MKRKHLSNLNKFAVKWARYARIYRERKKIRKLKKQNPHIFKPVGQLTEKKHKELWSTLFSPVDLNFLRYYCNVSGIEDHRFLPADIYTAIIERILNDANDCNCDMDKNRLEQIVGKERCPQTILRRIGGQYFDSDYLPINREMVLKKLSLFADEFIIKPSINSYGGRLVEKFYCSSKGFANRNGFEFHLENIEVTYGSDFIVQECIRQHPFTAQFNPSSVNTLRMIVYRSVLNEQFYNVHRWFRMGMPGAVIDNLGSGGINVNVNLSGEMSDKAIAKIPNIFYNHPGSGISFKGLKMPFMDILLEEATNIAQCFPRHRVLALDMALTDLGKPIVIEVNLMGVYVHQRTGGPYFGKFTEEIIEYCSKNKNRDDFRIFRI